MTDQLLNEYEQFISKDTFSNLKEFLECVGSDKIFREGQKSILCFRDSGSNGKTTLAKKIINLVGNNNTFILSSNSLEKYEGQKLVVNHEYEENNNSLLKKLCGGDIYYLRNTCFIPKCNIICVLNDSSGVTNDMLARFVFVDFIHTF